MVTGRTKGVTDRARGNLVLVAAQRDDGAGNPTEEYLVLRSDQFGQMRMTAEGDGAMVTGRTKGVTERAVGNVVLVAAQRDDGDGNPTEEYLILRADENGRLRTIDSAAVTAFLGLTDTPAVYTGAALRNVRVNAAENALEFVAAAGAVLTTGAMVDDVGLESYFAPGWQVALRSVTVMVADELYYIPIHLERETTFTRIACQVITFDAGSTLRMGIYAADFNGDGQITPGALTLDAGTVSSGTNGTKAIAISETLAAGYHFLAISGDGTPSLRGIDATSWGGAPVVGGDDEPLFGELGLVVSVTVADGAAALPSPATAPDAKQLINFVCVNVRI